MRTQKTYEQIYNFIAVGQSFLGDEKHVNEKTKIGYGVTRVLPRATKLAQEYEALRDDIDLDNAATEKKGGVEIVLRDDKYRIQYTKDGEKKRNAERRKLFNLAVDIEAHISPAITQAMVNVLNYVERQAFAGFVISQEMADAEPDDTEQGQEQEQTAAASGD